MSSTAEQTTVEMETVWKKAHQRCFFHLSHPKKRSLSGLTFSALVFDHILTSHTGDSIWSRLVINSRSAIGATNELPQKLYKLPKAGTITVISKLPKMFRSSSTALVTFLKWTVGEFKTNTSMVLHVRELFRLKWTKQRKRGETFFYTFCTISSLFPPLRPLSAECAEYAFHGQEAVELARRENSEKRHKAGEKGREREMFLLSLKLQYRKMDLLPRKPHRFLFFFFLPWSSRNTELPLRPEYLDRAAVTQSDVESGGKKESGLCCKVHQSLFLSCILPNWCSCETADGGVGAEVRLRLEILGFFKRFPNLHPLK